MSNDLRHLPTLLSSGPAPDRAAATLILVHGRGAAAAGMLELYSELGVNDVAAIAPQAARGSWYPHSFLAPRELNQPDLDSSLETLDSIVADLLSRGIDSDRIALLGFSQGACLALEFAASRPRRYGAVMALTGGLIGESLPPYTGSMDGTAVFLGTSDPDPHVPVERVLETRSILVEMGAQVDLRRYPGMPHTINEDELQACRELLLEMANRRTR